MTRTPSPLDEGDGINLLPQSSVQGEPLSPDRQTQPPSSTSHPSSSTSSHTLPSPPLQMPTPLPQPPHSPLNPPSSPYQIHASTLFSPLTHSFLKNPSLTISPTTGLITSLTLRPSSSLPPPPSHSHSPGGGPHDIDLRHPPTLLLPGLCDLHTHLFLHPYSQTPALTQMMSESPVERILRASVHARAALNAGWTSYRDLGTEGVADADVHLRNAINRGLVPGPRCFVAGEAIASSGGYAVRVENDGTGGLGPGMGGVGTGSVIPPRISDAADGVWGVRAAVRRRLAAGADVVKVYVDYRRRALRWPGPVGGKQGPEIMFPPPPAEGEGGGVLGGARNPNLLLWTQEEMDALVDEARRGGATVAAHASSARGVLMAAKAGVTSVEHGFEDERDELAWNAFEEPLEEDEALREMVRRGTVWVPTLSVLEAFGGEEAFERAVRRVKRGVEMGVRIGVGGDTGAGTAHGSEGVRELELLLGRVGMKVEEVLRGAMVGGWEAVFGREVREDGGLGCVLGWRGKGGEHQKEGKSGNAWNGKSARMWGELKEGWVADLVAVKGDVREDIGVLRNVDFVVKDGRVVRWDERGIGL